MQLSKFAESGIPLVVSQEVISRTALSGPFNGMYAWGIRNQVGESPVWDVESSSLYWIDVRAPAVLRLHVQSCMLTRWMLPDVVGALALANGKQLILALRHRLALLDTSTDELSLLPEIEGEPDNNRLNEGKVSPSGSWFVFGSMDDSDGQKRPSGSLYRTNESGHVTRLYTGLTIANGLAWSPEGKWIYFSDSFSGQVYRALWSEEYGTLDEIKKFVHSPELCGRPDGALVNTAGNYVSAGVSAGCINVFSPDGHIVEKVVVPVRAPTMPCVGGELMDRLFVTSLVRSNWGKQRSQDGQLIELTAPWNTTKILQPAHQLGGH